MVTKKHKGNQATSNSNDFNKLYASFDCHDFGCELEAIGGRLTNASTQRNVGITVSDADVLKVLRKQSHRNSRIRRGQTQWTDDMCRTVVFNSMLYF